MSTNLENAKTILGEIKGKTPEIKKAKGLLDSAFGGSEKKAVLGLSTIKNIIILLAPFIAYYKVTQVINLLKDLEKEMHTAPSSGFKKYI